MSITGIPPELLIDLQETLLRCGPFDTDAELKNVFVDARIAPWRDRVPQAANGKATRVDALIEYLYDQFRDDTQENALALFLRVVGEALDEHDACRYQLITLAGRLGTLLTSLEGTGMEPRSSQRSQTDTNSFDQQGQHVGTQINVAGDYIGVPVLPAMSDGETHGPSPTIGNDTPPDLEFANRKDLLMTLTHSNTGPYHLIDAPAQYGKSKLLEQVQIKWQQEDGWTCARVCLHDKATNTLPKFIRALLPQLEISEQSIREELLTISDFRQAGGRIGNILKSKLDQKLAQNPKFRAGVVLLLDIDENLSNSLKEDLIIPLLQEFIPKLERTLHASKLSQEDLGHIIFRLQVAGRYVTKLLKTINTGLPFEPHRLEPFNYNYVLEATQKYLGRDDRVVKNIAAHLMYYTAGHPGCIAKILQRLKCSGKICESFFDRDREYIWCMVDTEAHNVRQSIGLEVRPYVDDLSVFRYLDPDMLSLWMKAEKFTQYEKLYHNEYELEEALLNTQLMYYKGNLLRDSITRGLLARYLLCEKGSAAFGERCEHARAICERYLQDSFAQRPASWAMEALFQSLQCHISEIHDPKKRKELQETFFEATLPRTLSFLIKNRHNPQKFIKAMRRVSDIDTCDEEDKYNAEEFRFTINYFLREDEYNDEPYRQLKDVVARFSVEDQEGVQ